MALNDNNKSFVLHFYYCIATFDTCVRMRERRKRLDVPCVKMINKESADCLRRHHIDQHTSQSPNRLFEFVSFRFYTENGISHRLRSSFYLVSVRSEHRVGDEYWVWCYLLFERQRRRLGDAQRFCYFIVLYFFSSLGIIWWCIRIAPSRDELFVLTRCVSHFVELTPRPLFTPQNNWHQLQAFERAKIAHSIDSPQNADHWTADFCIKCDCKLINFYSCDSRTLRSLPQFNAKL